MCIKTGSRNTNSSLPIVIIVALVVSKSPELVLSKSSVIRDHKVFGSSNSSTSNVLSNQEEFKIVGNHVLGNDCSRSWVVVAVEEPIVNSLVHSDFGELWVVIFSKLFETFLDLRDFDFHDKLNLGLSYTISVEDNHFWKMFIILTLIHLQCFLHKLCHTVNNLLTHLLLNIRNRNIPSKESIH